MILIELEKEFGLSRNGTKEHAVYSVPVENFTPLIQYLKLMFPDMWRTGNKKYWYAYSVRDGNWMISVEHLCYDPQFLQRLTGEIQ